MIFKINDNLWFDNESINIIRANNVNTNNFQIKKTFTDMKPNKNSDKLVLTYLSATCCNLRCTYCYANQGNYDNRDARFFTLNKYIETFNLVKKNIGKISQICFFGGEPLLNFTEIEKFVKYLSTICEESDKPNLSIGSNGTILDNRILEFLKKYNIKLGTSLDGPKKINEFSRVSDTIDSVYDKVISNIKLLGKNNIFTTIQITIGKKHIDSYKKGIISSWLKEIETLPIVFYEITPVTTNVDKDKILLNTDKEKEKFDAFFGEIADYSLNKLLTNNAIKIPNIFIFLILNITRRKYAGYCGAGNNITITPNLEIYPCHTCITKTSRGLFCEAKNLKYMSKDDNFVRYSNIKRNIISKCNECIAKNICGVFCKGMYIEKEKTMPVERCRMMEIFTKKVIEFLNNYYDRNKEIIKKNIKKIMELNKVM